MVIVFSILVFLQEPYRLYKVYELWRMESDCKQNRKAISNSAVLKQTDQFTGIRCNKVIERSLHERLFCTSYFFHDRLHIFAVFVATDVIRVTETCRSNVNKVKFAKLYFLLLLFVFLNYDTAICVQRSKHFLFI